MAFRRKNSVIFSWFICLILAVLAVFSGAQAQEARPDVANYINEDGLISGTLVCAAVDPGGWAWVGAKVNDNVKSAGFSVVGQGRRIMSFGKDEGLAGESVNDILFDDENDCIWFATSRGLSKLDGKTGQWKNYNNANSNLAENQVTCLHKISKDTILTGTLGEGIYAFELSKDNFSEFKCPMKNVTDIITDGKGRLWASSREGVGFREKDVWVLYNEGNSTLTTNQVDRLAEDSEGRILGATQRGIVIFDGISWGIMDTSNSPLPVDHVTQVAADPNGAIWASTWGGGLVQIDKGRNLVKIFSRKNCDILDNKISGFDRDSDGNFWLCTYRGLSRLVVNPRQIKKERIRVINRHAYGWQKDNKDDKSLQTLQLSLGRHCYGFPIWGWTAVFGGEGFDKIDPSFLLDGDLQNNRRAGITGPFTGTSFAQLILTEGDVTRNFRETAGKTYPFPDKFPPEIDLYLKSGSLLPSDNPEIKKIAMSMVRESSKGDMMRTAEDVLYSGFFVRMPFDFSRQGNDSTLKIEDPRTGINRTPQQVLSDQKGIGYSKNRLACSMLKSLGIPARLVAEDDRHVWGEAYIAERGWVPFDVTMPYYAIGQGKDRRVQFPLNVEEANMGVAWISGSDDNNGSFSWNPPITASYESGQALFDKKTEMDVLKTADMLVILPAEFEIIPNESRIPVSKTLWMTIRMEAGNYTLKFYDKSNGRILLRQPITEYDGTITAQVEGRVKMTFIPVQFGRYVVLRMFGWEVLD